MGYLKNTINVQHAVEPLVFPAPDSPIVDQTTKSIEFTISSVVAQNRKIFCAPSVGTETLPQAGLKPGMIIRNATGFGRVITAVADDYIIVNNSGNFFGNQKFFAYAAKTDGVLLYVGVNKEATGVTSSVDVITSGGEKVTLKWKGDQDEPYISPVQITQVLVATNVDNNTSSDQNAAGVLYLF